MEFDWYIWFLAGFALATLAFSQTVRREVFNMFHTKSGGKKKRNKGVLL